jgi:hypothetical protein
MRIAATLAALAAFGFVTSAQAELYKDYAPSKAVWNLAMVKVQPNKIDDYLMGLKQSWINGCEINKKQGVLEDCFIYVSENDAAGPFNVLLVQKYVSGAMREPDEARYKAYMEEFRKKLAEDTQEKLVEGYNEFRTFHGEMDFRRVEWK